ncbi:MAG: hypothetical protein IPN31_09325 [Bacteroidetes bacterium]|nr:hypothetical protein [Bacteroidota bacterium]
MLPKELQQQIDLKSINPITLNDPEITSIFGDVNKPYNADAKMASISGSMGLVVSGQMEIDIVNINKGDDKGKTFAYFSAGIGLGAGTPDISFMKGRSKLQSR